MENSFETLLILR